LVAWRDEAMDFAFEFDLLVVGVGVIPFGEPGLASGGEILASSGVYRNSRGDGLAILDEYERDDHLGNVSRGLVNCFDLC
jgi:hypothetical protein